MNVLNNLSKVVHRGDTYEYVYLEDTNETQIWDTSGDPIINLFGRLEAYEVANCLASYYAGREVGKAVGANNARWEMRRALGID